MNDPLDQFWNSVLAAEAPSVDEMARAEANLRSLEPAAPLPQERIDALVQAAVRASEAGLPAVRRSHTRRLVAMAALLFLSMSVAWIVFNPLWGGTHAVDTLSYTLACRVASEPNQPETDRIAALGIIDYHFGFTIPALQTLCAENSREPLRSQARGIRDRLLILLKEGADRAPMPVDLRRDEVIKMALDELLDMEARQAALAHLGYLSEEGMRAFLKAEFVTTDGWLTHDYFKKLFAKGLAP